MARVTVNSNFSQEQNDVQMMESLPYTGMLLEFTVLAAVLVM